MDATALHSASAGTYNARYRLNQASSSPPPPPPPPPQPTMSINKKDKKRQALADRLTEISKNFEDNRDLRCREALRSLQADIAFINNARLYENAALDDSEYLHVQDPNPTIAGSSQAQPSANSRVPGPPNIGKRCTEFIHEINDALEEKDAQLTRLADNFNFTIDQLRKDYEYNISVAEEEHRRLLDTVRGRLVSNVQARRAALQRDKEKLDVADTNALLYHPNQFSVNHAASPGGPQGNRKTRHTRHRLELDDLESANVVNGKRKRKGLAEGENGSPIRDSEPLNGVKSQEGRLEDVATPTYTIEKLFTEKELSSHLQRASIKVLETQQAARRRKLQDGSGAAILDESDAEDRSRSDAAEDDDAPTGGALLEAPAMERSATNQSYHATRSTRNHNLMEGATRENLGELAGRQAAAELIGNYHKEKKKEDDYNRAPPLNNEGVEHDLALMAKAIQQEDQRRASDTNLLEDIAPQRPNYVGMVEATSEVRMEGAP